MNKMPSVLQNWVQENLTFMQQSVLLAAIRGPDTLKKDHVSKKLCRWLRRCVLVAAFEKKAFTNPYELGGGSFTGPSCKIAQSLDWPEQMHNILNEYIRTLDEVPHHFQLHFLHAAEILGYCYPEPTTRKWWEEAYQKLCFDMHLMPEDYDQMYYRLGDNEEKWRNSEVVTSE
jgi:hypothetical protein